MLRRFCVFFSLLGLAIGGEEINKLVDRVLEEAQDEVRRLMVDKLPLVPDFNRTWSKEVGPFRLGGRLRCSGGKMDAVAGFRRADDVTTTWDWGLVGFRTTLLFKEMKLSYRSCEIAFGLLKTSDPLWLRVRDVEVRLEMSLSRRRGRCLNYLERLEAVDFAALEAEMCGGLLCGLKEKLLERYVSRNRAMLMERINSRLEDISIGGGSMDWLCNIVFQPNNG